MQYVNSSGKVIAISFPRRFFLHEYSRYSFRWIKTNLTRDFNSTQCFRMIQMAFSQCRNISEYWGQTGFLCRSFEACFNALQDYFRYYLVDSGNPFICQPHDRWRFSESWRLSVFLTHQRGLRSAEFYGQLKPCRCRGLHGPSSRKALLPSVIHIRSYSGSSNIIQ